MDSSYPELKPVTVKTLEDHFRGTYMLSTEQAKLMVVSSATSLQAALSRAQEAAVAGDLVSLAQAGHSLKGLLLNMGQPEWAGLARHIEQSAKDGQPLPYEKLVAHLSDGMAAITVHRPQGSGE